MVQFKVVSRTIVQFTVMLGPLLLGRFNVYARDAVQFKVVPRTSPSWQVYRLCSGRGAVLSRAKDYSHF